MAAPTSAITLDSAIHFNPQEQVVCLRRKHRGHDAKTIVTKVAAVMAIGAGCTFVNAAEKVAVRSFTNIPSSAADPLINVCTGKAEMVVQAIALSAIERC